MEIGEVFFEHEPKENPDWGYARNKRICLKQGRSEFTQSIYSAKLGPMMVPNRDLVYEGLLGETDGEIYKFLDAVAFGIRNEKDWLQIAAEKTTTYPHKTVYEYGAGDGGIKTEYFLHRGDEKTLSIRYEYSGEATLVLKPIFDIRHMYLGSEPQQHEVFSEKNLLRVSRGDKNATIRHTGSFSENKEILEWRYKLGEGYREKTPQGVFFAPQTRRLFSPGTIKIPLQKTANITITIGENEPGPKDEEGEKQAFRETLAKNTLPKKYSGDAGKILATRLFVLLDKWGLAAKNMVFPEAGGMWFKTPWFRDVFETLYNNFSLVPVERAKQLVEKAFEHSQKGLIPNKLPEKKNEKTSYSSVDATLLAFLCSGRILEKHPDRAFAKKTVERWEQSLGFFSENNCEEINGGPVLEKNLLACVPWHTWTDSKRCVEEDGKRVENLPTRVPLDWQKKDLCVLGAKQTYAENNKPKYLLPEINALWIKTMDAVAVAKKTSGEKAEEVLDKKNTAFSEYEKVFWKNSKVFDSVEKNGRKNPSLGSCAVVAASLLSEEHGDKKLREFWENYKSLLVTRNPVLLGGNKKMAFGILLKDSEEKVYYSDQQYHEAVVWPRDTPYLIRLLNKIGEKRIVEELLLSNLDHQASECAVNYCQELFSLPLGKNPYKTPETKNPVPVKNPVQLWSQWVEPYYLL